MVMLQTDELKHLGVIFDRKLIGEKHVEYLVRKCQTRMSFMRMVYGSWWGCH
jgi:hypothetical protein